MRYLILITFAIGTASALTACDDDGDGVTIDPVSGTWEFSGDEPDNDSCDVEGNTLGDPDGDFEIANHGDGTFTVTPDDDTGPFDCTLSGASFDCPDRYFDEVDADPLDATVTIEASASGTFSSSTEASGVQEATISCDGPACSTIEGLAGISFPCDYTQTFTASAK
jgi:hypothetical protein